MSDHPKEAKRTLKRIHICDDSCLDVFDWLSPKKVGLEVALVSDRFDCLVDTHFKTRKWTLAELKIHSDVIEKWKWNPKWNADKKPQYKPKKFRNAEPRGTILPIPQIPLPNSVVGFSRVILRLSNSDAIAFLQRIGRLLQSDISLEFFGNDWDAFATSVFPLLNRSAILKIHFGWSDDFHNFRRLFSPSILCDCANLRFITLLNDQSLQFPPNDSNGSSTDGQALCQWLHTPRADGQPKVLKSYVHGFPIDKLKSHFLSATTCVNFILCLRFCFADPFDLVNSLTNEQMACRQIGNYWTIIVRCPIDKNAKQWAEWEKEAVDYRFGSDWKAIAISF